MPKVPESVVKESYLLKSTFFYNRLLTEGYFSLLAQIKKYAKVEGRAIPWKNLEGWHISQEAWSIITGIVKLVNAK